MGHGGVTKKEDKNNGGCWSLMVNGGWWMGFFSLKKSVWFWFSFSGAGVRLVFFLLLLFLLFFSFSILLIFFTPSAS